VVEQDGFERPVPVVRSEAAVTGQDPNPLLFAVTTHTGSLQVYSALNGRFHGSTQLPAPLPWTMWVP
jgi:hypothetical protein